MGRGPPEAPRHHPPGRQWGGVPGAGPEAAGSSLGLASGACGSLGRVSARRCVSCSAAGQVPAAMSVGFIGAGQLACALARGFTAAGGRAGACGAGRSRVRGRPPPLEPELLSVWWAGLGSWSSGGREPAWGIGVGPPSLPRTAREPGGRGAGLTSLVFRRHLVRSQDHSQLSGNGPAHGVRAQGRAAQGRGEQGGGSEVSRTVPIAGPGRPPPRTVPALWADPPGPPISPVYSQGNLPGRGVLGGPGLGRGEGRQPRPACLGEACACPAPSSLVQ